jgi:hypothetical protein
MTLTSPTINDEGPETRAVSESLQPYQRTAKQVGTINPQFCTA